MMMKEDEHIRLLLNNYWNGITSPEEECELQDFFCGENVPEDLQRYAPLFRYYKESRQFIRLNDNFDKKLEAAICQKEREKQYITIRIFAPVIKIAVSIVLAIAVGIGIYFLANENRNPYFAETYNDPNAALKEATFALEKLSEALQKGEKASIETLDELKDWNIDWTTLDSVNDESTENRQLRQSLPKRKL